MPFCGIKKFYRTIFIFFLFFIFLPSLGKVWYGGQKMTNSDFLTRFVIVCQSDWRCLSVGMAQKSLGTEIEHSVIGNGKNFPKTVRR